MSAKHVILAAQARQEVADRNLFEPDLEATVVAVKGLSAPHLGSGQAPTSNDAAGR